MAKAQFKLLLLLLVVGLFAGVLASGWWVYENVLMREQMVARDLASMKDKDRPRIDPGARRFAAATDLIRGGSIAEGRDALYKLLQQFPDSETCAEARRIIGEVNMDQLFSPSYTAGKKDYIVQPGDSKKPNQRGFYSSTEWHDEHRSPARGPPHGGSYSVQPRNLHQQKRSHFIS
jgi:hypothetical protein